MTPTPTPRLLPLVTLAVLLPIASPATAQDDPLPAAEDVLAKYIEATGGAAAYEKLSSRKVVGTIEFVAAGLRGPLTLEQQAPDKLKSVLDLPGVGQFVQGTDGTTAYEINPITGERLLDGAEKAAFLRESTFNSELLWRDFYDKAETTGVEDVDGTRCFVVVMTPKQGEPETRYYAADSGLLIKTRRVIESPMGAVPVESSLANYREVDGIKIPFVSTESLLGQEVKTTIESVEHGVEFPEGTFAIPESLRK